MRVLKERANACDSNKKTKTQGAEFVIPDQGDLIMPDEPISNSGIPRIPETPEYGRDKPGLGSGEETQQRPFSLPPEPGKQAGATEGPSAEKPSPMDIAREGARQQPQLSPEELSDQVQKLKNQLGDVQNKLQNPDITNKFSQDHYEAMTRLITKMNPDMRTIAKNSEGVFNPPQHEKSEGVMNYITRWLNGSQQTLSQAMNYLSQDQSPNPAAFLQLQFGVQRAVQRGELFASIVGASVSGIKTIMSTQLG